MARLLCVLLKLLTFVKNIMNWIQVFSAGNCKGQSLRLSVRRAGRVLLHACVPLWVEFLGRVRRSREDGGSLWRVVARTPCGNGIVVGFLGGQPRSPVSCSWMAVRGNTKISCSMRPGISAFTNMPAASATGFWGVPWRP